MENKVATTIEQSKELIELGLNVKTADMHYKEIQLFGSDWILCPYGISYYYENEIPQPAMYIPAWSLVALMNVLPAGIKNYTLHIIKDNVIKGYFCSYRNKKNEVFVSTSGFNVIDAVFEMIVYLKENKLI